MENGNQPATKHDLETLRSELKQDMAQMREELRSGTKKDLHDMETKLLTAFYSFARMNNMQTHDLALADGGMRGRIDIVERRLLDIEERLNMPPQAY